MCVSGTVTVVRCFLLVLVKTQTLPCNVLTRAGTRLRAGRARRVPPTDWQLLPALCSPVCRLLQLSLAYLVGCGKLMWLDVATELNQPSALTSSFKWPFLFLFFSPFPPPSFLTQAGFLFPLFWSLLFKSLWESDLFLVFHHHFLSSCCNWCGRNQLGWC